MPMPISNTDILNNIVDQRKRGLTTITAAPSLSEPSNAANLETAMPTTLDQQTDTYSKPEPMTDIETAQQGQVPAMSATALTPTPIATPPVQPVEPLETPTPQLGSPVVAELAESLRQRRMPVDEPYAGPPADMSLVKPGWKRPAPLPTGAKFIAKQAASGTVRDAGIDLTKGVVGVAEGAVGLSDLTTFGLTGKGMEAIGVDFKTTREILQSLYTPERKQGLKSIADAETILGKVMEYAKNPDVIGGAVIESAPSMFGGAAIGRALISKLPMLSPLVAAAIGEGMVSSGAMAEQVRQQNESGLLSAKQVGLSVTTGAATALLGLLGGKLGKRLGLDDVDTFLVSGMSQAAQQKKTSILRKIIGGAITEGAFEELPQSAQEQWQQNLATGRPPAEGVLDAALQGLLIGGVMGIGGQIGGIAARKTKSIAIDKAVQAKAPIPANIIDGNEMQGQLPPEYKKIEDQYVYIEPVNRDRVEAVISAGAAAPAPTMTAGESIRAKVAAARAAAEAPPQPATAPTIAQETTAPQLTDTLEAIQGDIDRLKAEQEQARQDGNDVAVYTLGQEIRARQRDLLDIPDGTGGVDNGTIQERETTAIPLGERTGGGGEVRQGLQGKEAGTPPPGAQGKANAPVARVDAPRVGLLRIPAKPKITVRPAPAIPTPVSQNPTAPVAPGSTEATTPVSRQPPVSPPADDKLAELEAIVAADKKKRSDTVKKTNELWPEKQVHFEDKDSEHRGAAIFPSASQKGKWQLSIYDDRGFSGHTVHDTKEKAIEEAVRSGYTPVANKRLSEYSAKPSFQEGVLRNEALQRYYQLAQVKGADSQVKRMSELLEAGKTQEALDYFRALKAEAEKIRKGEPVFSEDYQGPRFTYGLRYRPMQIGAQPKGYIIGSDGPGTEEYRHGTIQYPRQLTSEEVRAYELVPIKESVKPPVPPGAMRVKRAAGKVKAEPVAPATKAPEMMTPDQEYDASRENFKKASKAFTKIKEDYRAKKIGDAEFLAGKKAFDEASATADAAETKFIESKNKPSTASKVEAPQKAAGETVEPAAVKQGQKAPVTDAAPPSTLTRENKPAKDKWRKVKPAASSTLSKPLDSPMISQWRKIKEQLPKDTIVAVRLGDFYEFFFEDAKTVAPIIGVSLSQRQGVPMAGVPYHSFESYLKKIVDAGKQVSVAELKNGELLPKQAPVKVTTTPEGDKTVSVPAADKPGLPPKEQKKYLLAEIDKAIANAPIRSHFNMKTGQMEAANKLAEQDKMSFQEWYDKAEQAAEKATKTVTFEVPNDGTYIIPNDKAVLMTFQKIAERDFPASVKGPKPIKTGAVAMDAEQRAKVAISLYGNPATAADTLARQLSVPSEMDESELKRHNQTLDALRDMAQKEWATAWVKDEQDRATPIYDKNRKAEYVPLEAKQRDVERQAEEIYKSKNPMGLMRKMWSSPLKAIRELKKQYQEIQNKLNAWDKANPKPTIYPDDAPSRPNGWQTGDSIPQPPTPKGSQAYGDTTGDTNENVQGKIRSDGVVKAFRKALAGYRDAYQRGRGQVFVLTGIQRRRELQREIQRLTKSPRLVDRERWANVEYSSALEGTPDFESLAMFCKQKYDIDVIPIKVSGDSFWGGMLSEDGKRIYLSESDEVLAYALHELNHVEQVRNNPKSVALSNAVDLNNPTVKKIRTGKDWPDQYARDEIASAIVSGRDDLELALTSPIDVSIIQADIIAFDAKGSQAYGDTIGDTKNGNVARARTNQEPIARAGESDAGDWSLQGRGISPSRRMERSQDPSLRLATTDEQGRIIDRVREIGRREGASVKDRERLSGIRGSTAFAESTEFKSEALRIERETGYRVVAIESETWGGVTIPEIGVILLSDRRSDGLVTYFAQHEMFHALVSNGDVAAVRLVGMVNANSAAADVWSKRINMSGSALQEELAAAYYGGMSELLAAFYPLKRSAAQRIVSDMRTASVSPEGRATPTRGPPMVDYPGIPPRIPTDFPQFGKISPITPEQQKQRLTDTIRRITDEWNKQGSKAHQGYIEKNLSRWENALHRIGQDTGLDADGKSSIDAGRSRSEGFEHSAAWVNRNGYELLAARNSFIHGLTDPTTRTVIVSTDDAVRIPYLVKHESFHMLASESDSSALELSGLVDPKSEEFRKFNDRMERKNPSEVVTVRNRARRISNGDQEAFLQFQREWWNDEYAARALGGEEIGGFTDNARAAELIDDIRGRMGEPEVVSDSTANQASQGQGGEQGVAQDVGAGPASRNDVRSQRGETIPVRVGESTRVSSVPSVAPERLGGNAEGRSVAGETQAGERKPTVLEKLQGEIRSQGGMSRYADIAPATPTQDAEYLAAVERGDTATAQRMVDEAAKRAGEWEGGVSPVVYHGSPHAPFNEFQIPSKGFNSTVFGSYEVNRNAAFFTPDKGAASEYQTQGGRTSGSTRGFRVFGVMLDWRKGMSDAQFNTLVGEGVNPRWLEQKGVSWELFDNEQDADGVLVKAIKKMGYDGVIIKDTDGTKDFDSYVAFDPSQIKSADPITRDDKGNVIPLSERFNPKSQDIRYSKSTPTEGEAQRESIRDNERRDGGTSRVSDAQGFMGQAAREAGIPVNTSNKTGKANIEGDVPWDDGVAQAYQGEGFSLRLEPIAGGHGYTDLGNRTVVINQNSPEPRRTARHEMLHVKWFKGNPAISAIMQDFGWMHPEFEAYVENVYTNDQDEWQRVEGLCHSRLGSGDDLSEAMSRHFAEEYIADAVIGKGNAAINNREAFNQLRDEINAAIPESQDIRYADVTPTPEKISRARAKILNDLAKDNPALKPVQQQVEKEIKAAQDWTSPEFQEFKRKLNAALEREGLGNRIGGAREGFKQGVTTGRRAGLAMAETKLFPKLQELRVKVQQGRLDIARVNQAVEDRMGEVRLGAEIYGKAKGRQEGLREGERIGITKGKQIGYVKGITKGESQGQRAALAKLAAKVTGVVTGRVKPSERTYGRTNTEEDYKLRYQGKVKPAPYKGKQSAGVIETKLGIISTRLKLISPTLKMLFRKMDQELLKAKKEDIDGIQPLLKGLSKMPKADWRVMDAAMRNGDAKKILDMLRRHNLFAAYKQARIVMDRIYERAKAAGINIQYLEHFWPRSIVNLNGLMSAIKGDENWAWVEQEIEEKRLNDPEFGESDKAAIVNSYFKGYTGIKIPDADPRYAKHRQIKAITPELDHYFDDTRDSIIKYVETMNDAIAWKRMFGSVSPEGRRLLEKERVLERYVNDEAKAGRPATMAKATLVAVREQLKSGKYISDKESIDGSMGRFVLELLQNKELDHADEQNLRNIIKALKSPGRMPAAMRMIQDVSYADLLGQFSNALTQISDIVPTLAKYGWYAVPALGKSLVNMADVTKKDLGLDEIAYEFAQPGIMRKMVRWAFLINGLQYIDSVGKETLMGAAVGKAEALANKAFSGDLKAKKQLTQLLEGIDVGSMQDAINALIDPANMNHRSVIEAIAYNKLADRQPISAMEHTEGYQTASLGKYLYTLKSYQLKQFDQYRNDIVHNIKEGYASGDKDKVMEGFRMLFALAALFALFGATIGGIKDLLLGREIKAKDLVMNSTLNMVGLNRWTIDKAMANGPVSAFAQWLTPPAPARIVDDVWKDATGKRSGWYRTLGHVPVVGRIWKSWLKNEGDR